MLAMSRKAQLFKLEHKEEDAVQKMKHQILLISIPLAKPMIPFSPNVPLLSDPRPSLLRESLTITSEVLPNRDKPPPQPCEATKQADGAIPLDSVPANHIT